jgi:hypothetical protein
MKRPSVGFLPDVTSVIVYERQSCPSNSLLKHQSHERICVSKGTNQPFLTSALDGDEWSASLSHRLTPRETSTGINEHEAGRYSSYQ